MKIVFFDGVCNLCNSLIDWLIRHDEHGTLQFAPLQGVTAQEKLGVSSTGDPTTIIYWREGERLERSAAVIHILADLGGLYRLTALALFLPPFLRDPLYWLVARFRYTLFGRRQTCRLPTLEEKARFLP